MLILKGGRGQLADTPRSIHGAVRLDRDRLIICGPRNGDLGGGGVYPLQDTPRLWHLLLPRLEATPCFVPRHYENVERDWEESSLIKMLSLQE